MNTTDNPFAAPLTETTREDEAIAVGGDEEALRRQHLNHEASIKSIGMLYYIGTVFCLVVAAFTFFSLALVAPDRFNGELSGALISIAIFGSIGLAQGVVGYYLRKLNPKARPWAIVLSLIGLIGFPIGTLINLYFLYLLISKKGAFVLSEEYQQIVAATPHIKYKTSIVVWIFLGLLFVLIVLGVVAAIVGG